MALHTSKTQLVSTFTEAIWHLANTLIAAGWTCTAWGDGLSQSGSGTLGLTGAGTGALGLGNARAHVTLRHPTGPEEISWQHISSGTNWRIKRAYAGFTGTPATYNTVGNGPTERVICGSGTDASPSGLLLFEGTPTTARCWVVAADDGDCRWWSTCFTNGTLGILYGHARLPIVPPPWQIDPDPVVIYRTSSAAWTTGNLTDGGSTPGDLASGASQQGWPATTESTGAGGLTPNNLSGREDGADSLIPLRFERRASQSNPGRKGSCAAICWTGTARSLGTTFTVDGVARSKIAVGSVALDWDGTLPVIA